MRRSAKHVLSNVELYWAQFIESLPPTADRPTRCSGSDSFGFTPTDACEIAELVLAGSKTATGSLLWSYEFDGKPLPRAADYWIVTNGGDNPVCVVRTTEVRIVPFDEVTADYARDGGEGDLSLESWRRIYWQLIVSECARIRCRPSAKAPLVMEWFRVVYQEPFRTIGQQRCAWPEQGSVQKDEVGER
jgi:uncharacterized protein YhfF